jgi:hypothetical protein
LPWNSSFLWSSPLLKGRTMSSGETSGNSCLAALRASALIFDMSVEPGRTRVTLYLLSLYLWPVSGLTIHANANTPAGVGTSIFCFFAIDPFEVLFVDADDQTGQLVAVGRAMRERSKTTPSEVMTLSWEAPMRSVMPRPISR